MERVVLDLLDSTALAAAAAGIRKFLSVSPILTEISPFFRGPMYRRCDFVFGIKDPYTVAVVINTRGSKDPARPQYGELIIFPPRWVKAGALRHSFNSLRMADFEIKWLRDIASFDFEPFTEHAATVVGDSELPYNLRSEGVAS